MPPNRTAGAAPRNCCKFARQFCVPGRAIYPGKAKNSIDTLRRAGSTDTAVAGMLVGMVNVAVAAINHLIVAEQLIKVVKLPANQETASDRPAETLFDIELASAFAVAAAEIKILMNSIFVEDTQSWR